MGKELLQLASERDLEGMVRRQGFDPYLPDQASWLKIKNCIIRSGSAEKNYLSGRDGLILIGRLESVPGRT